ncbi:hypothetical protein [Kangiella sp. HZ709]|uniref:lipase/acyltransferase domain-containing protein n=1 Tax=Kangiella sp. HZ709 TaxID=2666328 RepID=UPI0012B11BFD|nr:hypothetical protein [Kangiella sp. HZ709]MRX27518.1 hypothetical protein [Kangiella sp. HZ709]
MALSSSKSQVFVDNKKCTEIIPKLIERLQIPDKGIKLLFAFCLALLNLSCNTSYKPDLKRLHSTSTAYENQPPIIFIPGITGSKLENKNTSEEIWPKSYWQLLTHNYQELTVDINPQTLEAVTEKQNPYSVTDRVAGRDFYQNLIEVLENYAGFQKAIAGNAQTNRRKYYLFAYDWRQDNVKTVQKLDQLIEQIKIDYNDPNLKVDIIAHSMGGLISRYYLRYGKLDVLDTNELKTNLTGAKNLRRVIMLGTPNFGSIDAINTLIEGLPLVFSKIEPETLATMPSMYQLFPHTLNHWIIKPDGTALARDQFDVELWKRFQWSIFDPMVKKKIISTKGQDYYDLLADFFEKHLERARRFVWALTVPYPKTDVILIAFGGDCHLTPARVVVEETNKGSELRMKPQQISRKVAGVDYDLLMLEPGDGTVTKASLLARHSLDPSVPRHKYSFFPLDYSFFLCEKHNQLTSNINFQDNLLHVLLSRDL